MAPQRVGRSRATRKCRYLSRWKFRRYIPHVTDEHGQLVGRYAAVGALVMLTVVILKNFGEYEGSDVIVVLGPLAALLGGAVGAAVRIVVRSLRRHE